jgi:hypothetical protein
MVHARPSLSRSASLLLCTALAALVTPTLDGVAFAASPAAADFGAGQLAGSAPASADPSRAPRDDEPTAPLGSTQPPSTPPSDPASPSAGASTSAPSPQPSATTTGARARPTTTPAAPPTIHGPAAGNGVAPTPVPTNAVPTTPPQGPYRGGGDVVPPQRSPSPGGTPSANPAPTPTLPPNALLDLLSRPGLGTQLVLAGAAGLVISLAGLVTVGRRRRRL